LGIVDSGDRYPRHWFQLAYGDALTTYTSQGSNVTEHIHAMPSGSRLVTAFRAYTSGSRHREQSFIVTSDGAERAEIAGRRPLGDRRELNQSDVLANVTRNLSRQDEKQSAVSMLERAANVRRGAIRAVQASLQPMEARTTARGRRRACRSVFSAGESTALWKAGYQVWPSGCASRASISPGSPERGRCSPSAWPPWPGRNGRCVRMSGSIGKRWPRGRH
jgi:hypothetical protein